MSNDYNHRHNRQYCPYCKTNKYTVEDHFHGETYCQKCGTVIIDNTLPRVTLILREERRKEMFIRNLWKRKVS